MFLLARKTHEELEQFLKTFNLSSEKTDVLEQIILQLAGVERTPQACRLQIDPRDNRVAFIIRGMTDQDALRFSEYLKRAGDDENVTCVTGNQYMAGFLPKETYSFTVTAPIFDEKILPLFKNEIIRRSQLADKDPQSLRQYKIFQQTKIQKASRIEDEGDVIRITPAHLASGTIFAHKRPKIASQFEEGLSQMRTRSQTRHDRALDNTHVSYDPVEDLCFYDTAFGIDEEASSAPSIGK